MSNTHRGPRLAACFVATVVALGMSIQGIGAPLAVAEASGQPLRAWMGVQSGQLMLNIEDASGIYPISLAQKAKMTASDAVHLDFVGVSVAISGNTVAVGMASTSLPGAVYVFQKPATGWANMTQTAKLTASDGAVNDYLGYTVAISGDTIVAGAPNAHGYQGAAYVFVKPASGWTTSTESAELTATGTYSTFGNSVAIDNNTIVVGSPDQSTVQPGAAYVFVKPGNGWNSMTQTAMLTSSHGAAYAGFGSCVAISGNTIVVGMPYNTPKVLVFVEPASGWANATETARLIGSGGAVGSSVAISGNTVVAGVPYDTIGSKYAQGAAFVFVEPPTGWIDMKRQTATLIASDGAAGDELGYGVSISNNEIVAGAPYAHIGSNSAQGAGYLFVKPSTGWKTTAQFAAKVTASDGAQGDTLGWSASLAGNEIVFGAPGATSQHGAAYLFSF